MYIKKYNSQGEGDLKILVYFSPLAKEESEAALERGCAQVHTTDELQS